MSVKPHTTVPRPAKNRGNRQHSSNPEHSAQALAAAELATLANLGPKSAQALVSSGIMSLRELRELGSVRAFAKIKKFQPSVTLNLLWALEGAICSLPWQTIAKEHRTSLLLALEQYRNGG